MIVIVRHTTAESESMNLEKYHSFRLHSNFNHTTDPGDATPFKWWLDNRFRALP